LTPFKSFAELRSSLDSAQLTLPDVVNHYLKNINSQRELNAFLEVYENEAIANAEAIQRKIKSGTAGRLAGMVLGIKDVFCLKDHKLTAGSRILEGFESQFTATSIQKLLDEDAIIIGRQNCDEFAMGSSNENSAFGPTKNAADPGRVPGGSSGGSAVAVQADMCFASIASDTGGSIRQPAAFCGLVGLKPTYSRISRFGLIAYGSSFDCVGPLTRSVEDAALLLEIMAGKDEKDSTSSSLEVEKYTQMGENEFSGKIGYLPELLSSKALQEEIREAYLYSISSLEKAGYELIPYKLPYLEYVLPVYYVLTTSEASTNLSRFDGIRYGHRSKEAKNLEWVYKKSRSEGFGKEVKKRIMLGTFALSADYHEAYFTKAQQVRRLLKESADDFFKKADFFLMPVTPQTAFEFGEKSADPLSMYLADIFTVWANLTGIAAISIPVGKDKNGLPIGLQVHAPAFGEKKMIQFAHNWERLVKFQNT
jgi:aspartyl-tRNA(Asn)/glutamyl-tRNA(Gln) amidotransferase subunit A